MAPKETVFLTAEEALRAVCFDFKQYGPQILLFAEIIRIVSDGRIATKKERDKNGLWISVNGRQPMQWLEGDELCRKLCALVTDADLDLSTLSAVCSRVFQSRVRPDSSRSGLRIETGMENFKCRQCGRCCRVLDYQNAVVEADVEHWRRLGRDDVLKWVGVYRNDRNRTVYRIWTIPGTRRLASVCPFLEHEPTENHWLCQIHEVKPTICRNYPVSRKHALMTGCPGFNIL